MMKKFLAQIWPLNTLFKKNLSKKTVSILWRWILSSGTLLSCKLYWLAMCFQFSNLFPCLQFSYLVPLSYPEELDCLKTSQHFHLNQKSLLRIPDTSQRHRPGPQEPGAHHLTGPWMDMFLQELLWMVEFLQRWAHKINGRRVVIILCKS